MDVVTGYSVFVIVVVLVITFVIGLISVVFIANWEQIASQSGQYSILIRRKNSIKFGVCSSINFLIDESIKGV